MGHAAQPPPPDQHDEGFTLIELLVVIIIIGILASIAVPTFLGQRDKAHNQAMKTDLRNIASFAELYYADYGKYAGFEASTVYANYDKSQNVTLDVLDEDADSFCIQATHLAVSNVWYFDSDGSPQLQETGC